MTRKKVTQATLVNRPRVTIEELDKFVRAYQAAESLVEVAKTMGWKVEKVRSQAARLRKKNVPLKELARKSDLTTEDAQRLAKLC